MTREEQMLWEYREGGLTYREIGALHGVSGERVRQLIGNQGHRPGRQVLELQAERRAAYDRVVAGDSTVEEEAQNLGLTVKYLRSYLGDSLGLRFPSTSPQHGTSYRYSRGCRCKKCRAAVRAEYEARKAAGPKVHGTSSAYRNYGCRCPKCTAAHTAEMRERRNRRKQRDRREAKRRAEV